MGVSIGLSSGSIAILTSVSIGVHTLSNSCIIRIGKRRDGDELARGCCSRMFLFGAGQGGNAFLVER